MVTKKDKSRNKKETFRQKIDRLVKEEEKKRRIQVVKTQDLQKDFNKKGVPLRINQAKRINLNINPDEYEHFLRVSMLLDPYFKIEGNPLKSQFYKDSVHILTNVIELIELKKMELDDIERKIKEERLLWKFKTGQ